MATIVKSESDITFYGTVVIPAYVEKCASGVLNFSKPRLIKRRASNSPQNQLGFRDT